MADNSREDCRADGRRCEPQWNNRQRRLGRTARWIRRAECELEFQRILVPALLSILSFTSFARADSTVIWISIDGLRHDYIDRARPPTLMRLKSEGAFTNDESPIFPSLTFPNHAAQVTGALPDRS